MKKLSNRVTDKALASKTLIEIMNLEILVVINKTGLTNRMHLHLGRIHQSVQQGL